MTVNPASTLEFKREVDIKVSFRVETPSVGSRVITRRHVRTVVDKFVVDKYFWSPSSKVRIEDGGLRLRFE